MARRDACPHATATVCGQKTWPGELGNEAVSGGGRDFFDRARHSAASLVGLPISVTMRSSSSTRAVPSAIASPGAAVGGGVEGPAYSTTPTSAEMDTVQGLALSLDGSDATALNSVISEIAKLEEGHVKLQECVACSAVLQPT
mgnify:CR=1 FL=1